MQLAASSLSSSSSEVGGGGVFPWPLRCLQLLPARPTAVVVVFVLCAQAPSAGARHTCEKESRRRKRDIKTCVCVCAREIKEHLKKAHRFVLVREVDESCQTHTHINTKVFFFVCFGGVMFCVCLLLLVDF